MKYRRVTNKDCLLVKAYLDSGLNGLRQKSSLDLIALPSAQNSSGTGEREAIGLSKHNGLRICGSRITTTMRAIIDEKMKLRWSPEQISNRLK